MGKLKEICAIKTVPNVTALFILNALPNQSVTGYALNVYFLIYLALAPPFTAGLVRPVK